MIRSLLEDDLYTFTMQQAILHNFPDVRVRYRFKCRDDTDLLHCRDELQDEIGRLASLRFSKEELEYLRGSRFFLSFIKPSYIEFLKNFQLCKDDVRVFEDGGRLAVEVEGNWFHTIPWEVKILATINEIHFRDKGSLSVGRSHLREKIDLVNKDTEERTCVSSPRHPFQFACFGLRRRYSSAWHDEIISTLKESLPNNFVGTSNVYLAMKHGVKPIGTMAHQWIQAGQGLFRPQDSQKMMLDLWAKEYRGELGIALSDTLGHKKFLEDFDKYFANLYAGTRHDSGDPVLWGYRTLNHYKTLGIDSGEKAVVFSDGLDFPKAISLAKEFDGLIRTSAGIGTNLTCDVGVKPAPNVLKLVEVNGSPVAKISDSPGKGMCEDRDYLDYLKRSIGW